MPYDVFISYASADRALAEEVNRRLVAERFKVWFDKDRLDPGYDWHRLIELGCENSRVLLPILTPRWKLSDWTKYETYGAEAVVPLLFEGDWTDVATPPLERFQAEILDMNRSGGPDWARLFTDIRRVREQPLPEKAAHITHLHYRPNPFFMGREKELIRIHEGLHCNPMTVLTQGRVRAIAAMGGAGKTTLARHYVEKFWRCYSQIFWVDCRIGFEREFAHIHDFLSPERTNIGLKDADKAVSALNTLNGQETRLLILDNAEDEKSTMEWIPKTGGCQTLITSRFAGWSAAIKTMHLYVLDKEPACKLLQIRSGRTAEGSEIISCETLAEKLGFLPLALEQAAAYIEQQGEGFGFGDYLRLYRDASRDLLDAGALGSTEYPDSVITTWKPSIERLMPGARIILRLCSFFAPTPIPIGMIIDGVQRLREYAAVLDKEPVQAGSASAELWSRAQIANLKAYSLARVDGQSFSFHPLVQAVERFASSQSSSNSAMQHSTSLFLNHAPTESYKYPNNITWRTLIPHAEALWSVMQTTPAAEWNLELPKALSLFYMKDKPDGQEVLIQRKVLDESLRRYGALHAETLLAKNDLALMLDSEHKDEALLLYREALDGRRAVCGEVSLEVGETLGNMGYLLQATESPETEEILRKAIDIHTQTSGAEHWRTLSAKSTLAAFFAHHGKYDSAEDLCRDVLRVRQRVFGDNHENTLSSLKDLAYILQFRGNTEDALTFCRQAVVGYEKAEGAEHPDTLQVLWLLAELLRLKGEIAEEAMVRRRLLGVHERHSGRDSRAALVAVNNLAEALQAIGKLEEAEVLFRRACAGLGHGADSELSACLGNLTELLEKTGRFKEATLLRQQILDAQERELGSEQPDFIKALNNHAYVLRKAGLVAEAEAFDRRAAAISVKVLGETHPLALHRRNNLVLTLILLGKLDEAREILTQNAHAKAPQHENLTSRIPLLQWIVEVLAGKASEAGIFLGGLKSHFAHDPRPIFGEIQVPWDITYFVEALQQKLGTQNTELLRSLVAVLNARSMVPPSPDLPAMLTALDAFLAWREAALQPFE